MNHAPAFLHRKLHTYVNQDYADNIQAAQQTAKWFIILRSDFIRYFTLVLISILYFSKLELIKKHNVYNSVFAFILYFSLVNNLISIIPSVGRFQLISFFLLYCYVFFFLQHLPDEIRPLKRAIYLALPLIIFYIIFQFRIGFQTINILTIIGNPLLVMVDRGMAVLDFLKK